jgi:hypothetical protein
MNGPQDKRNSGAMDDPYLVADFARRIAETVASASCSEVRSQVESGRESLLEGKGHRTFKLFIFDPRLKRVQQAQVIWFESTPDGCVDSVEDHAEECSAQEHFFHPRRSTRDHSRIEDESSGLHPCLEDRSTLGEVSQVPKAFLTNRGETLDRERGLTASTHSTRSSSACRKCLWLHGQIMRRKMTSRPMPMNLVPPYVPKCTFKIHRDIDSSPVDTHRLRDIRVSPGVRQRFVGRPIIQ